MTKLNDKADIYCCQEKKYQEESVEKVIEGSAS